MRVKLSDDNVFKVSFDVLSLSQTTTYREIGIAGKVTLMSIYAFVKRQFSLANIIDTEESIQHSRLGKSHYNLECIHTHWSGK